MVSNIWTPSSDTATTAEEFRVEIEGMLKKVAHEHKCNVEDLKFTVNNMGVVNIRHMTPDEIMEEQANIKVKEDLKIYRRMKGFDA